MTREIKFKVWDGEKMYEPFFMRSELNKTFIGPFSEKCIFLQFTGLIDKAGKEIYEGDVVKTNWQHDGIDNYDYEIVGEIKWSDHYISFRIVNKDFDMPLHNVERESFCDREENNSEVLGNIYQNHELIK